MKKRPSSRWIIGVALLFASLVPVVSGAVFNISTGDVASLKSAINTSNTNNQNDTINLSAGTYSLTASDNTVDLEGNGLPVILPDGGHTLTINGNGAVIENDSTSGSFRFLQLGSSDIVTISNVTFVNGGSAYGGAIYKDGTSNLTLQNCAFTGNNIFPSQSTPGGGAICNGAGMLTIQSCTFSGNYTETIDNLGTAGGGAIFNGIQGTANITNSTFTNNQTHGNTNGHANGGAIENDGDILNRPPSSDGIMTITGCTFNANSSSLDGGAIKNSGQLTVISSLFEKNSAVGFDAAGDGGAISNENGTLTVENCTFYANEAKDTNGGGGAIESTQYGTGPDTRNASLTVLSCTFARNVSRNGSSIDVQCDGSSNSLSELANNIFALGDTGVLGQFGLSLTARGTAASINSEGYNLSDDTGGGYLSTGVDQINTNPQLDSAGLQNNGGPTLTIALTSNSPAIDKGKSFGLTTDQRGLSRPFDLSNYPNAAGGDGSDIGAYEAHDIIQTGTNLVVTTLSDHDDGTCGSDCSLREAINRANGEGNTPLEPPHTITFSGAVTGTMTLSSELDIDSDITIQGPGARNLALSGNSASRVFALTSGSSTISGLTIENGSVAPSAGGLAQGGGIYNGSTSSLTINNCAFTGNVVKGGNGAGLGTPAAKGQGGALYNEYQLTVNGCTFSNNMATGGNGAQGVGSKGGNGAAGEGGAVFNIATTDGASGQATLTNCTFYNNTARGGNGGNGTSGGNGGNGDGGAVGNAATLVMKACTVSSNNGGNSSGGTGAGGNGTAGVAGGGITNLSGAFARVGSSISANNVANGGGGVDVDGAFSSDGYNLLGTADHSTGFTATGDMKGTNVSPLNSGVIGPPSNTGGPTDTFTLTSNSLAINASSKSLAPHRDQRGYLRTGSPDIGAYEFNGSLLNLISVTQNHVDLSVGVEVVKGNIYRIQRKLNLSDTQWQTIPTSPDITATGNDTEQLHDFGAITTKTHAFYQVIFVQ